MSAQFVELCIIFWRTWYYRNCLLFFDKKLRVQDIVPWSLSFLAEFESAISPPPHPSSLARVRPKWEAPSPGWFKINSNAAIDSVRRVVGFGVIIRNDCGQVLAALYQSYLLLVSVEVAKAMAIRRGILLAVELGISPVGFESDASSLISSIIKGDPPLSDVGLIVANIIHLVSSLSISHISFTSRLCNGVAHGLAKSGLSLSEPLVWIEDTPPCVEALILFESLL
ncbi:hypothetical protein ACOSQ2_013051 [Xanthoceras sorbifolium]